MSPRKPLVKSDSRTASNVEFLRENKSTCRDLLSLKQNRKVDSETPWRLKCALCSFPVSTMQRKHEQPDRPRDQNPTSSSSPQPKCQRVKAKLESIFNRQKTSKIRSMQSPPHLRFCCCSLSRGKLCDENREQLRARTQTNSSPISSLSIHN